MWALLKIVPFTAWLVLGLVVAGMTYTGIIYGKGYAAAKHASMVADLQAQTKFLRETLAKRQEAYVKLAEETAKDDAVITELTEKIEQASAALEDAQRQCFTEKDTEKLKELWQ